MNAARRAAALAALPLILLAAAALRAWPIGAWPLWLDESWSRWLAEQDWASLADSTARFDTHPPFYYSLLKLWLAVAPDTPAGMRLLSVIAGVATAGAAILCARQVPALRRRRPLQFVAGGLVALSPALVIGGQQARPYALLAFAFTLALGFALRLLRTGGWQWWTAYAVSLPLVLWLHNLGFLFGAALGLGLLLALAAEGRLRSELRGFVLAHLAAGLVWVPVLLGILEQRRAWTSGWLRFVPAEVPQGLTLGLVGPGIGALLVLLFAGLGVAAMARLRPDRASLLLLLSAALAPAAMEVLLSAIASPVFLPRTLIPSAVPLLILAVVGLARLRAARERGAAAFALAMVLGFASATLATRPAEEKWDRLGVWLSSRIGQGEEIWLLPNEIALPLRYAAPNLPARGIPAEFPAPAHPGPRYSGTRAVPGMTEADAAGLVAEARRRGLRGVWVVSRFPALFDPGGALPKALGAPLSSEESFAPLTVAHYPIVPFNEDTGTPR
jgi:uncharacterized membrane protein